MVVTDSPACARALLPGLLTGPFKAIGAPWPGIGPPHQLLEPGSAHAAPQRECGWRHVLVREVAPMSQYDQLIALARDGSPLPHGIACLAGTGSGFHGFRDRPWVTAQGNIHLTAVLTPLRPIPHAGTIFTVLAANAVVDTLDGLPGLRGRAGIKWVNDILVEGAKVGGALAWTQSQGDDITGVIVGIGLNVENTPGVERSPEVPAAGSLRDFVPSPDTLGVGEVVLRLLAALERHYTLLLREGAGPAMDRYRARSAVVGREVMVRDDREQPHRAVLARGRVLAVGDGLELYLEGNPTPLTRGRLEWAANPETGE
jgi:biotin-(acetyl-CoA carboxylase) ligase